VAATALVAVWTVNVAATSNAAEPVAVIERAFRLRRIPITDAPARSSAWICAHRTVAGNAQSVKREQVESTSFESKTEFR
jgi:hypothetical protein